jgi:hypothetical protein
MKWYTRDIVIKYLFAECFSYDEMIEACENFLAFLKKAKEHEDKTESSFDTNNGWLIIGTEYEDVAEALELELDEETTKELEENKE